MAALETDSQFSTSSSESLGLLVWLGELVAGTGARRRAWSRFRLPAHDRSLSPGGLAGNRRLWRRFSRDGHASGPAGGR